MEVKVEEIWKDIPDYEGLYQISDLGRVKSLRGNEKILKQLVNRDGYYVVRIRKNKKRKEYFVHRLMALCFINYKNNYKCLDDEKNKKFNVSNLTVNHIDKNRLNNNISNLEWCSLRYNINYSSNTLKIKPIEKLKKLKKYILNSNINEDIKKEMLNIIKF